VQETQEVQESNEPEVLILKRKNVKLRKEKEEAERQNIILKDKVASLTSRSQKLTKKVADQDFELQQLRQQVDTLADLPAERDRYKEQVKQLKAEVAKLEMQLRQGKDKTAEKTTAKTDGK
jgi:hypothetical protein